MLEMLSGLALKVFVDGGKPSLNFVAMHSRDGQASRNFFAETFTSILPPPATLASNILTASFAGAIATMPTLPADKCECTARVHRAVHQ